MSSDRELMAAVTAGVQKAARIVAAARAARQSDFALMPPRPTEETEMTDDAPGGDALDHPMWMVITLKSGAQVRTLVTDYAFRSDKISGRLTGMDWDHAEGTPTQLVYLHLEEMAAVHLEEAEESTRAYSQGVEDMREAAARTVLELGGDLSRLSLADEIRAAQVSRQTLRAIGDET